MRGRCRSVLAYSIVSSRAPIGSLIPASDRWEAIELASPCKNSEMLREAVQHLGLESRLNGFWWHGLRSGYVAEEIPVTVSAFDSEFFESGLAYASDLRENANNRMQASAVTRTAMVSFGFNPAGGS